MIPCQRQTCEAQYSERTTSRAADFPCPVLRRQWPVQVGNCLSGDQVSCERLAKHRTPTSDDELGVYIPLHVLQSQPIIRRFRLGTLTKGGFAGSDHSPPTAA